MDEVSLYTPGHFKTTPFDFDKIKELCNTQFKFDMSKPDKIACIGD